MSAHAKEKNICNEMTGGGGGGGVFMSSHYARNNDHAYHNDTCMFNT